jgi:hypothetical protein
MQSLQTTELLSFHPALLETGVSVGIAPLKRSARNPLGSSCQGLFTKYSRPLIILCLRGMILRMYG